MAWIVTKTKNKNKQTNKKPWEIKAKTLFWKAILFIYLFIFTDKAFYFFFPEYFTFPPHPV